MNKAAIDYLAKLAEKYTKLKQEFSEPEVFNDHERSKTLGQQISALEPFIALHENYLQLHNDLETAQQMLDEENNSEMSQFAQEEILQTQQQMDTLQQTLENLIQKHETQRHNELYIEIRAGTGGDEAGIFVGDLFRMYARFAEKKGWSLTVINSRPSEHGGYKEIVVRACGETVFEWLQFESGTHRVQRVPQTESQGRIHTSACTVAILPANLPTEEIVIERSDIRIDTFRASGAGGQHVNKTDSAVRITHLPTSISVECQAERSQHRNKERAMSLLQAKLMDLEEQKKAAEESDMRRNQVGSGDRSQRIRTYNFPQKRVTDHRIQLSLHSLDGVMMGELDELLNALIQDNKQKLFDNAIG